MSQDKNLQAYVIGLAIGDGNLSKFPRTVRLRISCDNKYPHLMDRVEQAIQLLLPENKISRIVTPRNCTDICCYSNYFEDLCGWSAAGGSKIDQNIRVPQWIKDSTEHTKHCLRGLFETDGSSYTDRGYRMANFTTALEGLAMDVIKMTELLGYAPNVQKNTSHNKTKYTVRISKNTQKFIDLIDLHKD